VGARSSKVARQMVVIIRPTGELAMLWSCRWLLWRLRFDLPLKPSSTRIGSCRSNPSEPSFGASNKFSATDGQNPLKISALTSAHVHLRPTRQRKDFTDAKVGIVNGCCRYQEWSRRVNCVRI
jgi:hypothetical protein